jgi:hypothetical protein
MPPVSSEYADEFQQVGYEASKSVLIDRLNVMGFTLQASRLTFEEGVRGSLPTRDSKFTRNSRHSMRKKCNLTESFVRELAERVPGDQKQGRNKLGYLTPL